MRPNKMGWGLVAFFLIGGIAFWIKMPEIFIGQIWVGVSLFLAAVYLLMTRAANRAQTLMATGVRGQAQILEMTQTGVMVNDQPRVKFKLRISAPGIPSFEDERTQTVPLIALGQLSMGTPLAVFLTPDKPGDYVIDWSGAMSGGVAAPGSPTGGLMGDIRVSDSTGTPTVVPPGSEAAQAVMAALTQHGIDPKTGTVDLRQASAARDAVLKALRDHGVDVAHQLAVAAPAIPIQSSDQPVERMTKLTQLRDAGLISAEEFEANKKRILEEL
jgi:hypothetical protein